MALDPELDAATAFLASYLPPPSDKAFARTLHTTLQQRYAGHWHTHDPERGSAFRALVRSHAHLDSSIVTAATQAGVQPAELDSALQGKDARVTLGDRWTLWVDPGCVSLRVDRGEASSAFDGQFIEIYGKLPESLRAAAIPLASVVAAPPPSSNIVDSHDLAPAPAPSSPVKRSRAIQIVAPPGGRSALQAMTNAALRPDSPAPATAAAGASSPLPKPIALLASPLIIPPTPQRPLPAAEADVFSPTPSALSASSALLLGAAPRSPSPAGTNSSSKYGSLSPSTYRPSSPLGMPLFTRRSSSRTSSVSSSGGDASSSCSDGETSGTDSLFSAISSGDSVATSTAASSISSLWKGADPKSRDPVVDADGFRVPALPARSPGPFAHAHAHSRGSSISSLAPPPSPSTANGRIGATPLSPSGRSLPGSPTKPRRRGVRGGQGHRSESTSSGAGGGGHSHHSSVSSITSLTSTATPSTPSGHPHTERSVTPSSGHHHGHRHRTETSSSAQTVATEYSNGLVKVLGGGVLLGCASSSSQSTSSNSGGPQPTSRPTSSSGHRSTTPNGEPSSTPSLTGEGGSAQPRRRRRERGRGGRAASNSGAAAAAAAAAGAGGGTSPMGSFSGQLPSPYAMGGGAPVSPVWMGPTHAHASPFQYPAPPHAHHQQQQHGYHQHHYGYGHPSPMQA
ncbi:hypothetical protein JCM6882_003681 [Rhodosporidiobolus microsporus]